MFNSTNQYLQCTIDTNPLLLSLYNISCSAYLRMAQTVHSNVQAGNNNYLTVFQFITTFHYMIESILHDRLLIMTQLYVDITFLNIKNTIY